MSDSIPDDEIVEELKLKSNEFELKLNFDELNPADFIFLNDPIICEHATFASFHDHLKEFGDYSDENINLNTTASTYEEFFFTETLIFELKLKLKAILQNDYESYETILQEWFDNQINYQVYETRIRECLNQDALYIHNQLILTILRSSFEVDERPLFDNLNQLINKLFDIDFDKLSEAEKLERETFVRQLESSAVKNEPDEDEEETMIKRIKKKKRVKYNPFGDDEDDDVKSVKSVEDHSPDGLNDFPAVKKKRKVMRIFSDDEDDVSGTLDSDSNQTTVVMNDTKPSTSTKAASTLLDQLLNSNKPISLLDSEAKNRPKPTENHKTTIVNNHVTLASPLKTSNVTKPTLLRRCLSVPVANHESKPPNTVRMNSENSDHQTYTTTKECCVQTDDSVGESLNCDYNSNEIHSDPNDFDNLFSTKHPLIVEPTLITLESLLNAKDFQTSRKEVLVSIKNHPTLPVKPPPPTESVKESEDSDTPVEILLSTETDLTVSSNNQQSEIHTNLNDLRNLFFRFKIEPKKQLPPADTISQDDYSNDSYYMRRNVYNFEKYDPIVDISGPTVKRPIEDLIVEETKDEDDNVSQKSFDSLSSKPMTPLEKIDKLKTCFQEVSLPDNVRLGLRISDIALNHRITSVDDCVTYLCNASLKNLIRNILAEIILSRSSFQINERKKNFYYNIGTPSLNPYLRNTAREFQFDPGYPIISSKKDNSIRWKDDSFINGSALRLASSIRQPDTYSSNLRRKKFGIEKNGFQFTTEDQIDSKSESIGKFRSFSGPLYVPDATTSRIDYSCNLRHLFNVLNTNRSLIPVHSVWSKALYRTISALNNVPNLSQDK